MPIITIAGTPIAFPDSGESPNWAPAVIQFAQVTASALSTVIGSFDVPPQQLTIDALTSGTLAIPSLLFSPISVRGSFIDYSIYRNTSLVTATETGLVIINYNPTNTSGNKWELIQFPRVGNAQTAFTISDAGQISITTTLLSGTNHNGFIYFTAKSMLN